MVILILVFISIFFLVVNYAFSDRDVLQPSVVFCFINLVSAIIAFIMYLVYGIEFHWNTVVVLSVGMGIFSLINAISWFLQKKRLYFGIKKEYRIEPSRLKISSFWIIAFLVFEFIIVCFRISYIRKVVYAIYGKSYGLLEMAGKYNNIVKNQSYALRLASIEPNKIYSIGWPLCISFNFVLCGVGFYRKTKDGRFPFLYLIHFFLLVLSSFLGGGRTAAFRYILAFAIMHIIISRNGKQSYREDNSRIVRRLIPIVVIIIVILGFSINIIGRKNNIPVFEYATAYIGAPLYNLDVFYNKQFMTSSLFGQQTFQPLYQFLGTHLRINEFIYDLDLPYLRYNGHYLGNVYTMYYPYIKDFGWFGIISLTTIMACYYAFTYRRLMRFDQNCLGVSLFLYAYLFNDLVMALFANKFYETLGTTTFFVVCFGVIVFWGLVKQGYLSSGFHYFGKNDSLGT